MAKKKGGYRKKAKTYARGGGLGGLVTKPIIDGLLAGGIGQLASKWIGLWGHPAATLGVGIWQNNSTLKTEGAREIGAMLAQQIPFIGGGRTGGGY